MTLTFPLALHFLSKTITKCFDNDRSRQICKSRTIVASMSETTILKISYAAPIKMLLIRSTAEWMQLISYCLSFVNIMSEILHCRGHSNRRTMKKDRFLVKMWLRMCKFIHTCSSKEPFYNVAWLYSILAETDVYNVDELRCTRIRILTY